MGVPQNERRIIVDKIEPLVAVGVVDPAAAAMVEIERVRLYIERRARVTARQRARGAVIQRLRARRGLMVAFLDRRGLNG
jgi:hypothetical protein